MIPLHSEAYRLEHRTQARVRIQIPISVTVRTLQVSLAATCRDLSWGGMLFTLPQQLPNAARVIRIELPWKRGQTITADAHILRSAPLSEGVSLVAARFSSLSPRSQSRLERLLKLLRTSAAAAECSGPKELVRELALSVNDVNDLRRMLTHLATGWHTVTVFDSYALDQSICLSITGIGVLADSIREIHLRARVVEVQEVPIPGFEWAHLYDLALEFEHPRATIKAISDKLLEQIRRRHGNASDYLDTLPDVSPAESDALRSSASLGWNQTSSASCSQPSQRRRAVDSITDDAGDEE
jgi:hypothetical protein